MRKLLIILFCLLSVNICVGESIEWHSGVVVLRSNEVLNGELALNPVHDVVLFRQGEQVSVYPAHKIQSVYYYDEKANINRKFTCIQQRTTAFTVYQLFEIVLLGEITVLRRAMSASSQDDASGYLYYVRSGEEVIPFHKFRAKLYSQLMQSSESLAHYIKENKLDPTFTADIILIVDFYNRQQNVKNAMAWDL